MNAVSYKTCDTNDILEEEKLDNFQPSGKASSCIKMTEAEYIDIQYIHDNGVAPHKVSGKGHKKETKKECVMDPFEKKTVDNHRVALPELIESEDEIDSESEIEQEDNIETSSHQTWDTDDSSEEKKRNIFRPSGKENSCMKKIKVESIDSQNSDEKIEFMTGRKPKDAIEGDLIRFMYKDPANESTSWIQGRLSSRIDKLDDAINSEWMMNVSESMILVLLYTGVTQNLHQLQL